MTISNRRIAAMAGLWLTLATVAATVSPACADDPATVRRTVEALIEGLDAATLAERSRSERDLLDLGPEALPFLPAPELTRSQAARESLKRIRLQLERRAARESALASRVTLQGHRTLAEVLKELTRQTRNRIELDGDVATLADRSVTVDWDQLAFWDAVADLQKKLGLKAVLEAGQNRVLLVAESSQPPDLAVLSRGPFRLIIRSAEVRPIVGQPDRQLVRLSAFVGLEPRIRPLFVHFAAADLSATGLQPWNSAARYELPVGDAGRQAPLQFDFVMPTDADSQLKTTTVSGRISVQLAATTERIVFDTTALQAGTIRRRGGVSVRLRDVIWEADPPGESLHATIKVLVGYDTGGPAFESHRTWMFHNAAYLEIPGTPTPRRVDFTDYDTSLESQGAIGVDYRWNRLAAPTTQYQFVYEAPTLVLDQPFEFSVADLPLPVAPAEPRSP